MKLIICVFLFLLSVALPAQIISPQANDKYKDGTFVYAFKATGFCMQLPNYAAPTTIAYGVDYSFYLKRNRVALFVGYTPLYSFIAGSSTTSQLNCINYGIQFELAKFNKANAFYLCFYNLYNRQGNYGLALQKNNFINVNPKYRQSFFKNIFSFELGVIAGFRNQKNLYSSGPNNLNTQFGFNVSLAFNFSTLFK